MTVMLLFLFWGIFRCKKGIYSAIFMDVRMDKMDGLEATKVIRSMDRADAKRIPIIALTDYSFD